MQKKRFNKLVVWMVLFSFIFCYQVHSFVLTGTAALAGMATIAANAPAILACLAIVVAGCGTAIAIVDVVDRINGKPIPATNFSRYGIPNLFGSLSRVSNSVGGVSSAVDGVRSLLGNSGGLGSLTGLVSKNSGGLLDNIGGIAKNADTILKVVKGVSSLFNVAKSAQSIVSKENEQVIEIASISNSRVSGLKDAKGFSNDPVYRTVYNTASIQENTLGATAGAVKETVGGIKKDMDNAVRLLKMMNERVGYIASEKSESMRNTMLLELNGTLEAVDRIISKIENSAGNARSMVLANNELMIKNIMQARSIVQEQIKKVVRTGAKADMSIYENINIEPGKDNKDISFVNPHQEETVDAYESYQKAYQKFASFDKSDEEGYKQAENQFKNAYRMYLEHLEKNEK